MTTGCGASAHEKTRGANSAGFLFFPIAHDSVEASVREPRWLGDPRVKGFAVKIAQGVLGEYALQSKTGSASSLSVLRAAS